MDFNDPKLKKMLAGLGIAVLLLMIYFFTSFIPWFSFQAKNEEIKKKIEEINKISAEVQQAKDTARQLPELQKKYIEMYSYYLKRKGMLPTNEEVDYFLREITSISNRNMLQMVSFEVKQGQDFDLYREVPFNIEITASSFYDIMNFLISIGKMERLVNAFDFRIDRMTAQATGPKKSFGSEIQEKIKANFNVTTYVFKQKEGIKDIREILPAASLAGLDLPFRVDLANYEQLKDVYPVENGIRITFSEPINKKSVENNLKIEPMLRGKIEWLSDYELNYVLSDKNITKQKITITLNSGFSTTKGKVIKDAYSWTITAK